jgi:hypothetical protein
LDHGITLNPSIPSARSQLRNTPDKTICDNATPSKLQRPGFDTLSPVILQPPHESIPSEAAHGTTNMTSFYKSVLRSVGACLAGQYVTKVVGVFVPFSWAASVYHEQQYPLLQEHLSLYFLNESNTVV